MHDQFLGVPVKLGKGGAEQVIQIKLTADEQAALNQSAAAVKELTTDHWSLDLAPGTRHAALGTRGLRNAECRMPTAGPLI